MEEEDLKYLKFGDTIILKSQEPPFVYLVARSLFEENVYMLRNLNKDNSYIEYPNTSELIFTIQPKLYCQENKKYQKARKAGVIDDTMEEMFQRRLKAEADLNRHKIEESLGTFVTIGDEVQLYHVQSQSYVKATTEKNQKAQNMFNLKLTKQSSNLTHFFIRINPFMNFKKTGEKITYEDSFYFDNFKTKSIISNREIPLSFKNQQEQDTDTNTGKSPLKTTQHNNNYGQYQNKDSQQSDLEQYQLQVPPVIETLSQFSIYDAGHRKEEVVQSNFQAILIVPYQKSKIQINKPLRYGDYIRLSHITKKFKKKGTVYADYNVCGTFPELRLMTDNDAPEENKIDHNPATSIFQIIPDKENKMGQVIQYDNKKNAGKQQRGGYYGRTNIRLRQVLTGRYLILDAEKQYDGVYLSERYDYIIYQKKLKENDVGGQKEKFFQNNQTLKDKEKNNKDPYNLKQLDEQEIQQNKNKGYTDQDWKEVDPVEKYLEQIEFTIESTSHEENQLHRASMIQLKIQYDKNNSDVNKSKEKCLKIVDQEDLYIQDTHFEKEQNQALDFMQWKGSALYSNMNPMQISHYNLELVEGIGDYFYFEPVQNEELNNIEIIHNMILPLMSLDLAITQDNEIKFQFYMKQLEKILHKVGCWMCGVAPSSRSQIFQITSQPIAERQYLIRESGIIDMVVKLVNNMLAFNKFSEQKILEDELIERFTKTLLEFIQLMTDNNKPNSFYIFQWYSLFKQIIMTHSIAKSLRFDSLVRSWLNQLEIQMSYKSDMKEIAAKIKFSEMNLNALNLLTAFVGYNEYREKVDQEEVVNDLMKNDNIRSNIFRKLDISQNDQKLVIIIDEKDGDLIEYELSENPEETQEENQQQSLVKFLCTSAIINMMIDLCKGGPQYVIDYIKELYPIGHVKQTFEDNTIHYHFRSLFISLFIESYFKIDLRYCSNIQFPQFIQFSKGIKPTSVSFMKMKKIEQIVNRKYEHQNFNIKQIINNYLDSLFSTKGGQMYIEHIKVKEKDPQLKGYTLRKHSINQLTKSLLQLCQIMLKKGFYYVDECIMLKQKLMNILHSNLNFYLIQQDLKKKRNNLDSKSKDIPIELCNNICEVMTCLQIIEDTIMNYQLIRYFQYIQEIRIKFRNQKKKIDNEYKLERLMKFVTDNIQISKEDHFNIYMLHEWMLLEYPKLNAQIMDYLFNKFSQKQKFMENAQLSYMINSENIQIFDKLIGLYHEMHFCIIDLDYASFTNEETIEKEQKIYQNLNQQMLQVVEIFFVNEEIRSNYENMLRKQMENIDAEQQVFSIFTGKKIRPQKKVTIDQEPVLGKQKQVLQLDELKDSKKSNKEVQKAVKNGKEGNKNEKEKKKNNKKSKNQKKQENVEEELRIQMGLKIGPYNFEDQTQLQGGFKRDLDDDFPESDQSDVIEDDADEQAEDGNTVQQIKTQSNKVVSEILQQETTKLKENQSTISPFSQILAPKKNLKRKSKFAQRVSQQLQQNLLKKSIFYRIFENYNIRIEELHQNQNFLKGLNYHQNILHLLQLASAANTKIWKTEELKQVKTKLMETCICVLTYFVLRNQENAQIILKNPLTADVITKVTAEKDLKIQKISYIFINELYQNHFQLVLNFSLEFNTDMIRRMIMKQNTNLSQIGNESYKLELAKKQKDKKRKQQILDEINSGKNDHCVTSFIYFLETLPKFFKIKDKSLQQNQEHISRLFQTECGNLRAVILDIFEQVMKEKIQVNANNEYEKEQVISSKQIILLCFLKNFRQLLSRCSTESINYARSIFSLQDLKRIIISQEDFYPLKLEAIMFLTDIYISGKNIEDNDYQEIYNLFKNHLFKQLNDFSGQIMHRLEYTDVRFINKQIQNIFSTNYLYSAQDYLLNIPYFLAYEQYILFGITRAFLYFQEKMPDSLSDNDAYLIQEYQDFCDKYMVDYFQRPDKYRRQRNTHQRKSQRGLTVLGIPGKNINSTGDKENAVLETSSHSFNQKLQLVKILVDIFSYDYVKITLVNGFKDEQYQDVQAAFNVQINKQQKNFFIEKKQLEMEHEKELNLLTQLLLQVKLTDPDKFKSYLYQYINILSQKKQNYTSSNSAMKVLRKISNYKQNMDVAESIQKDLCSLGFLKYICEVIINESESQKLEYIVGLVDFLDEANKDIQENFYQYLLEDDQMNYFILQIKTILDNNFKQFREYERSKTEIKQVYNYVTLQEQSGSVFTKQQQQKINIIAFMGSILNQEFSEKDMNVIMEEFNKVIFNKLQICKYVLEVVRLGCENHFSSMQQYMRKQININKQLKKNPVNMIRVIADLFQRYSKIMNGANIDFGIQILDTLIEMIQGPCKENQFALVNTKILESLEDIMMDIHRFQHASKEQESQQHHQQQQHTQIQNQDSQEQNQQISGELLAFNRFKDVDQYKFSKFLMKVFLFISSLFEGDADPYILNKIDLFININLLFKIIQISYERYEKINKEINKESYSLYYLIKYRTQVEQIEGEIINFDFNSKKKTQIGELGKDIIYYSRANLQLKQAFSAFNLMQSLVQLSPNFASQYKEQLDIFLNQNKFLFKSNLKQQKIYQYFNENCISIEIINSANELQKVFFRKPLLTNYLSDTTKIRFEENVRRDSSTDKLNALLEQEQTFEDEMHHILRLSSILKRVNLQYLTYFRNINIVLIFIQNLFILFTSGNNMDQQSEDIVQTIKQVFGMIQMSSAIIIWLLFLLMEMPVDAKRLGRKYKKQMKKKYQQEASQVGQLLYAFYQLCVNSYLFYLSINIFISVMGFFYNQVFYSFLMLDIVDRFSVLKNVIRSITQNSTQLLMTALLGGVILYIYAIIGYSNQDIRDSFQYANETDINMCTSAFDCFIFILNSGLRQGGGVGDIIQMPDPFTEEKTYNLRVVFDLSFFIIMIIIWMNIVFGIIIDTFAELRDDKKQRDMDRNNVCFICNINRNQYENNNVNFEQHIQKDHYIWNYIYYIQHLKGKDQNDFDGTETYIYEKWQNGDLTWFPVGRSLSLDNQFEDSEDQIILKKLGDMDKNLEKIKQKIKFLS